MWFRIAYRHPAIGFSPEPLAVYHLSVPGSIVKKYRKVPVYAAFIERHFDLAKQAGAVDAFRPAAAFIMRRWIRGMLFEGRKDEIRELTSRFSECFSTRYRALIYLLTIWPGLTRVTLRLLSRIVRTFHLRRRVVPPPPK